MKNTHDNKIVITLVNYFNDDEVVSFIKNQLQRHHENLLICVVNNGSNRPNELTEACSRIKNVHLIDAGKNSGYFGAAGIALNYLLTELKMELPSLFILSNSDLLIQTTNFFSHLQNNYSNTSAGIIGPRIVSTKFNQEQNPYYVNRIAKSKLKRIIFLYSMYPAYECYQMFSNIKSKIKGKKKIKTPTIKNVYAVHGSMMIFSKTLFQKVPTFFSDAPFLFGEEIYAAEVCRQNNLSVVYDPALLVYHNEHATTGIFKSKKSLMLIRQSLGDILKKYFN